MVSKKDKKIKGIPYGISDFKQIALENYYYIDKTGYLPRIEEAGRFLFFIRPRRFGKSLFLSMMQFYYDVLCKDHFEELFKETWIHSHPTDERGKYLVLAFSFSDVDPAFNNIEASFLDLVRGTAVDFIDKYKTFFSSNKLDYYSRAVEESRSASDILRNLLRLAKSVHHKMYVIIDEYDNFSNTLLTTSGEQAYRDLTRGEGILRAFFNVLKGGTGGADAPISRLFITGVSPVTMDDVTSGFNIGKNVSLHFSLNRMLGFTSVDVVEMIDYYRKEGKIRHESEYLVNLMAQWYGNYIFSGNDEISLFNSDMVLYFLDNYMRLHELPDDLIDRNVRIDYGKLRHLIIVDQGREKTPTTNGNFSKLKQITAEGSTLSRIVDGFPLEDLVETNNFKSLLFYFGLLTIKGRERDRYRLQIPNETVRRLFYDYIERAYKETGVFSLDLAKYSDLMSDMAYDGKWRPLVDFVTEGMKKSMALRDLMTGEKAVQAFLNVYLGLSDLFIIHTEKEMNKGYADLVMEPFLAKYEGLKYAYLLEIKYAKSGIKADSPEVQALKKEGEEQLNGYALDEKFNKTVGKTELIKLLLVFSGHEAVYIGDVS